MLVRTALTLSAIWLIPRADTPRIRSYLSGRAVPCSVDNDGRLFARVETDNLGGLQYFLGQHEPTSRPWQNPAQQEDIFALILFMLLDPTTWLMLFACARALSRIGDRISRIGRRNRLATVRSDRALACLQIQVLTAQPQLQTSNIHDDGELHSTKDALDAPSAHDCDPLHGQDDVRARRVGLIYRGAHQPAYVQTPKRKDARLLDDQRSEVSKPVIAHRLF